MLKNDIGKHIRELRKQKLNATQEEFSRMIGWDRTYLSRVEAGKQNITIDNFEMICQKLGITPKEFFDDLNDTSYDASKGDF